MHAKFFALIAAFGAMMVYAQDDTAGSPDPTDPAPTGTDGGAPPIPTDGISECILGCITPAAEAAGCTSFADINCVCASADFQAQATTCLTTNCTPEDIAAALALQTTQCAGATPGGSDGGSSDTGSGAGEPTDTADDTASGTGTGSGSQTGSGTGTGSGATETDTGSTDDGGAAMMFTPSGVIAAVAAAAVGGLML